MRLINEIAEFLKKNGFEPSRQTRGGAEVLCTSTLDGKKTKIILPIEITASSTEDSSAMCLDSFNEYPIVITEDRWRAQQGMTQSRLLAHLEIFSQAYARNCEVRRIDKATAQEFLDSNHSYGYASCKYRYGLFLKRQTGHLASGFPVKPGMTEVKPGMTVVKPGMTDHICHARPDTICHGRPDTICHGRPDRPSLSPGMLIAVATFSNARKWTKGDKEIRSYEWTRYASFPYLRINGGMGKVLKAFIEDVRPDDIMSYADLEWSEGDVYRSLGFENEGTKAPVLFSIDTATWTRTPIKPGMTETEIEGKLFFQNFGSNKYRLKLTDYE